METRKCEYQESQGNNPYVVFGIDIPDGTKFDCYFRTSERKQDQRILTAETSQVEHLATNFGENSNSNILSKYLVGQVQDNKILLLDADVFGGQTMLKGHTAADTAFVDQDFRTARNMLGETFGTKKKKQEIKALEKNRINVRDVRKSQSKMETIIEEKLQQMPQPEALKEEAEAELPIPPFDKNTDVVSEIYKIENIIDSSILNRIPQTLSTQSEFVESKLKLADPLKLRLVYFIDVLFKFRALKSRVLNNQELFQKELGVLPNSLTDYLFAMFCETSQLEGGIVDVKQPDVLKHKLIAYILVIALIINDFTVDVNLIAKDLKLTIGKATDHFKSVGCKVSVQRTTVEENGSERKIQSRIATLIAPLTFPKIKYMKK